MKLIEIPGVGARIRDHLISRFGTEEAALNAILHGDVASLLDVVSERQALSFVQWVAGLKYGAGPDGFLATEEARIIYQCLIARMATFAHTEYARLKIGTLFPSSSFELIMENRGIACASMDWARRLEGSGLGDLLSKIKPLKERPLARMRDRAILVDSPKTLQQLKLRGLDRLIDVHLAESPREMVDSARGYSHVCVIGDRANVPDDLEYAESLEDWYLVPESVLGYFRDNQEILLSATRAAKKLQDVGICSFDDLEIICNLIQRIGNSDEGAESVLLAGAISRMSGCVNDAVSWANDELKQRIESSQVTLGGMDLLQALGREEGIRDLFLVQMSGIFREILKEAKAKAASSIGLSGSDALRLDDVFGSEIQYPLEIDRQSLLGFEQELRSRVMSRSIQSRRELARGLVDKKEAARKIVASLREFDFSYAIGTFALNLRLELPSIVEESALGFCDGRNLFLEEPMPVSYSLGRTSLIESDERIALLSGVNSGGKTSLLDLLAQIIILAHMGMPVPARDCRICIFKEFYYFGKSRGTLSAGAFETAMRKFAQVENGNRKVVLADELESITEPGASAKIIACMLDELNRLGSLAVFVSHLAGEVRRLAETPVRVDGIEASGLDAENNLIVRRTPIYNHLARSTPELILDRLVKTTSGSEREFYSRLLAKFK